MATAKKALFTAWVTLRLEIGIPVTASTMEEALKAAKELKVHELIDFDANKWDHNDSEMKITGIMENG